MTEPDPGIPAIRSLSGRLVPRRCDLDVLCDRFDRDGRVVVPDILDGTFAAALQDCLAGWTRWALVTRVAGVHRNFDAAAIDAMDEAQLRPLRRLIHDETRGGMQYLYERHPLHDVDYEPPPLPPVLESFRGLLHEGPLLDLGRSITGMEDIAFGDGQLTRYRAGHFLTRHDDAMPGRQRRAAYVLGLTSGWRADDGGQLQFLDEAGQVTHVVLPRFNALCLFRVPQPHLVSAVSPFTEASRLSITGWLRAR